MQGGWGEGGHNLLLFNFLKYLVLVALAMGEHHDKYFFKIYFKAIDLRRLSEQIFHHCAKIYQDLLYSLNNMRHVWTP